MTKKELAVFDGMQGEVEMVIPLHWVKVKGELLSAYYRDGQPVCFSLPKMNDCGMELRKASDLSRVMDGEAMLPKFNFKPSEETIAEIKRFSEKMNDPKFKELMKEAEKLREWTTDAALRDAGFLKDVVDDIRSYNVGDSDYSQHKIQPWDIWEEYHLNPWDADIVKRTLRKKVEPGKSEVESRIMDYEKIMHICKKRIEQLKRGYQF